MTMRVDLIHLARIAPAPDRENRSRAANDDATPARVPLSVGPAGWDPYEIWASRVRDPRAGKAARTR